MISQLLPAVAEPIPSGSPPQECRVYERYACGLPSRCQPASSFGKEDLKWTGILENVSKGGVCLNLNRRFEKGTGLAIELPGNAEKEGYTVLARVVHVRRQESGKWALGCQFISELSDDELQRLLPDANGSIQSFALHEEALTETVAGALPVAAPNEPHRIPQVFLMVEISPQTTIGCLVPEFAAANCSWPLVAGTVGMLKGTDDLGNTWKLKVKIRQCQSVDEGWNIDCQLVDHPPRPDLLRALGGLVLKN